MCLQSCLPINIYPGITLCEMVTNKDKSQEELFFTTYDYEIGLDTITFHDKPFGATTYTFDQLGTTIYLPKYDTEPCESALGEIGGTDIGSI